MIVKQLDVPCALCAVSKRRKNNMSEIGVLSSMIIMHTTQRINLYGKTGSIIGQSDYTKSRIIITKLAKLKLDTTSIDALQRKETKRILKVRSHVIIQIIKMQKVARCVQYRNCLKRAQTIAFDDGSGERGGEKQKNMHGMAWLA